MSPIIPRLMLLLTALYLLELPPLASATTTMTVDSLLILLIMCPTPWAHGTSCTVARKAVVLAVVAAEITFSLAVALTVTPLLLLFGETVQEVPSHCAMRVESDSRRKRDVLRPPETRLPAEDQRRLAFPLWIITVVQIIIIITTIIIIIIMLHRRLGFTTSTKTRKKFLITRRRITKYSFVDDVRDENHDVTTDPFLSWRLNVADRTGPALSTILRCDE